MPESDAHIPGMNAVSFVAYCGELAGLPRADAMQRAHEVLFYVGLGEARYRNVETYSTGMKQRIKLAQALVHDPDLLFLDEPTNGMDPKGRDEMLELIRDLASQQGRQPDPLVAPAARRRIHLRPRRRDGQGQGRDARADRRAQAAARAGLRAARQGRSGLEAFVATLSAAGLDCHATDEDVMRVFVPGDGGARDLFALAARDGVQVRHLRPSVPTLEDVFAQRGRRGLARMPIHDQGYRRYAGTADAARPGVGGHRPSRACARASASARSSACCCWRGCRSSSARCRSTRPRTFRRRRSSRRRRRRSASSSTSRASFVFFVTIYVGAGLIANDRRANALQIYLSKPMTRAEYVARQAGDPDDVSAAGDLAAGDHAAGRADVVRGQRSRSSATTSICCRRSRCSAFVQARWCRRRCWRCRRCRTAAASSGSCTRADLLHDGALRRAARRSRGHRPVVAVARQQPRRSWATRSSGCRCATSTPLAGRRC